MKWQPPIPSGALYSKDARALGPALALLAYCYDLVRRDGWIKIVIKDAAGDMDEPYQNVKRWWRTLREGPFFCEAIDRGNLGWSVRFKDEWIDWRILNARPEANGPTQTNEVSKVILDTPPSSTNEVSKVILDTPPSSTNEGSELILDTPPSSTNEGSELILDDAQVQLKYNSSTNEGSKMVLEQTVYKDDHHDQDSGDVASRKMRSQRPAKKARDPTPVIIRQSLAEVCGFDLTVCSKENALNVNVTAKRLYEAGQKAHKTPEETADTIRYVAGYFSRIDWRGKKGDRPTPKQLVDVWGAAIAARKPVANGYTPPADKPPDVLSRDEVLARLAQQGKKL